MFTIYIVDRANQIWEQTFETEDEAYGAADAWEAIGGCDIYTNRLQACLAKDKYDRFLRNQQYRAYEQSRTVVLREVAA